MPKSKTFVITEKKNGELQALAISAAESAELLKLIKQNRYGENVDVHMNDFVSDLFILN